MLLNAAPANVFSIRAAAVCGEITIYSAIVEIQG